MTIGERIAFARSQRKLTQTEFAALCGIAQTHLSRYESGKVTPRKLAIARMADVLAVNFQWLLSGEGEWEEYPAAKTEGLTVHLDGELSTRLQRYAQYAGLTLEEAVADILDFPLSAYGSGGVLDDLNAKDKDAAMEALGFSRARQRRRLSEVVRHLSVTKPAIADNGDVLAAPAKQPAAKKV